MQMKLGMACCLLYHFYKEWVNKDALKSGTVEHKMAQEEPFLDGEQNVEGGGQGVVATRTYCLMMIPAALVRLMVWLIDVLYST